MKSLDLFLDFLILLDLILLSLFNVQPTLLDGSGVVAGSWVLMVLVLSSLGRKVYSRYQATAVEKPEPYSRGQILNQLRRGYWQ